MIRTFVGSGVLIEAFRGSSAIAISALAILNDANREFVTSELCSWRYCRSQRSSGG